MLAKKVAQKKVGRAGKTPKWVPPALSSSDDEGGPSLQELAEKITALEKAKARKRSAESTAKRPQQSRPGQQPVTFGQDDNHLEWENVSSDLVMFRSLHGKM
ncbi:UNVERIFIED_CONTAM: hypothetical protein K2H54_044818 [Gekko kuhli]